MTSTASRVRPVLSSPLDLGLVREFDLGLAIVHELDARELFVPGDALERLSYLAATLAGEAGEGLLDSARCAGAPADFITAIAVAYDAEWVDVEGPLLEQLRVLEPRLF